jgi:hypothetical protein
MHKGPMNEFWSFIKDVPVAGGKLPLVHTTDMQGFRRVEAANALRPQPCPVYRGERLLYFFYGRPAYRAHRAVETTTAKSFAPVCFIMSDQLEDKVCRIMPFDTGAFHNGLMHPPMHPDVPLSEYELGIETSAPMKLIKTFFGTERRYYDRMPLSDVVDEEDSWRRFSIDSFNQLIRNRSNSRIDDRVCAIEIQVNKDVELRNRVEAVILPSAYLQLAGVGQQIDSWGAIAIPYDLGYEFIPKEIIGVFWQAIRDFLVQSDRL